MGFLALIFSLRLLWVPGDASIRCEQLDLLLQWGAEFRRTSSQLPEGEKVLEDLVAFDVVLGDLNFDNCSSGMEVNLPSVMHFIYPFICQIPGYPGNSTLYSLVFFQRTNWNSSMHFLPSTGTHVAWGQERTSRGLWVMTL